MKKIALCILTVCFLTYGALAQNEKTKDKNEDFQSYNQDKKISHFIGFQANELIRQLFSFGNTIETGNPFLLKYSLRFNKSNIEITSGLGYRTGSTNENSGTFITSQSDLFFRLGAAKKYDIGKRFEAGIGIDGLLVNNNNSSENTIINTNINFTDSSYSSTSNKIKTFGAGPQFTFAFYITPRVKLGTELTAYFTYSENNFDNLVERKQSFNGNVNIDKIEDSGTSFSTEFDITMPISLFLSVKF